MNFFAINSRQGFASYGTESEISEIPDLPHIVGPYRKIYGGPLTEYMGNPPRKKPGRLGDFHENAYSFFVNPLAMKLFDTAARGKLLAYPISIAQRETESFCRVFVTNFVDCLDLKLTDASPAGNFYKNKPIGVIRRAIFDESRWDGSDLFVVPQNVNYHLFCTENFVDQWKKAKLKGIMFTRFLMDPDAIVC